MNKHVSFALAHPVFDPDRQILPEHFWWMNHEVSIGLTVNIGME